MKDDPLSIFRRLAVKQHVLLGGLTGARAREFDVALAAAATTLPEGTTMTEPEVNEALKAWLAGPGSMLDTDHVELRRWLIDMRLWKRDGYGRSYSRAAPPTALAPLVAALDGVDQAVEASAARALLAAQRAERRARHASGQNVR